MPKGCCENDEARSGKGLRNCSGCSPSESGWGVGAVSSGQEEEPGHMVSSLSMAAGWGGGKEAELGELQMEKGRPC